MAVDGKAGTQLTQEQAADVEAYNLYLRARHFWNRRTKEGLETAAEYFRQAIERDPSCAQAYAGLADTYAILVGWKYAPEEEALQQAAAAAGAALELDETLAEAHAARGLILYKRGDLRLAQQAFLRAIELNPNYASAHQWYGMLLYDYGEVDETLRQMRRAHELDPLSSIISRSLALALASAFEFEAALVQYEKTIELDPSFAAAHYDEARLLAWLGRFDEALRLARRARELSPLSFPALAPAWVLYWKRDYEAAIEELKSVIELRPDPWGAHLLLSRAYAQQGLYDAAIEQYRSAPEQDDDTFTLLHLAFAHARSARKGQALELIEEVERLKGEPRWNDWIGYIPWYDPLRSDARFSELVRNVGLD